MTLEFSFPRGKHLLPETGRKSSWNLRIWLRPVLRWTADDYKTLGSCELDWGEQLGVS